MENKIQVLTGTEKAFVTEALELGLQYDLIISDADHDKSDEWFPEVVEKLLARGGVAFFHDVTSPDYPNLRPNTEWMRVYTKLSWKVFSKNSKQGERCDRGLLMVMKP